MNAPAHTTLVLGVGSILWADDGIGVRVLDHLGGGPWDTYDGGVGGLGLLSVIEPYERVIIVDAIDCGRAPGTVFELDRDSVEPPQRRFACHQFDLADMLNWARAAGIRSQIHLIGIQPEVIEMSDRLGGVLEGELSRIAREVRERIEVLCAAPGAKPAAAPHATVET